MKKRITKLLTIITLSIMLVSIFSSCVSSTRVYIDTDVDNVEVYVDGKKVGTSPTQIVLSNAVWEDPDIVLKKEGYKDLHTNVNKELKGVNLVCGLLLWWPSLLYCYGPKSNQTYIMIPENN